MRNNAKEIKESLIAAKAMLLFVAIACNATGNWEELERLEKRIASLETELAKLGH